MSEQEIEDEIQARVNFKMEQLLTAVKNSLQHKWNTTFQTGSPRLAQNWEAFGEVAGILRKESSMATPCKDMNGMLRRTKRDIAIDKLMDRFKVRGSRESYATERFLVYVIEEAQNW